MNDRCSISDMGCKEVINLENGQRLGYIGDAEFDCKCGQITAFIIFGRRRFFGLLGRCDDIRIKWDEIEKIGEDIVLIRKPESEIRRLPEKKFYY